MKCSTPAPIQGGTGPNATTGVIVCSLRIYICKAGILFPTSARIEESEVQTKPALPLTAAHTSLPQGSSAFGRSEACVNNVLPRSCGQDCYA